MMLSREQMVRACLLFASAGLLILFFLSFQQNYVGVDEALRLPSGASVATSGIVKSVSNSGSFAYIEICENSCVRVVAQGDAAKASAMLISPDDIVRVEGRTAVYSGKVQINANSIEKIG